MKEQKTNVMRILDKEQVSYTTTSYSVEDGKIDGVSVAEKIHRPVEEVYKTLVVQGKSGNHYVCVIPVSEELDLKKVSGVTKEKNVEMLHVKDLLKTTGYIRGGCSPIGMKKAFPVYIEGKATELEWITCSAGKIGIQITLAPHDLLKVSKGSYALLC